jgi:hypothetical protein
MALGIRNVLCSPSLRHLLLPAKCAACPSNPLAASAGERRRETRAAGGSRARAREWVPVRHHLPTWWPAVPLTRSSRKRVEDDDEDVLQQKTLNFLAEVDHEIAHHSRHRALRRQRRSWMRNGSPAADYCSGGSAAVSAPESVVRWSIRSEARTEFRAVPRSDQVAAAGDASRGQHPAGVIPRRSRLVSRSSGSPMPEPDKASALQPLGSAAASPLTKLDCGASMARRVDEADDARRP